MKLRIAYENSYGNIIELNDGNYFVNEHDLRNYEWTFEEQGRPSGLGGRVRRFSRLSSQKTMSIAVRGADFADKMNALLALTEPDILRNEPGKLWLNNQYIICYLAVSSTLPIISDKKGYAEKSLTILAVEPFWHSEQTFSFSPEAGGVTGGKRYNLKFPYRFGTGYSNQRLVNEHYASSPIILTIYGVATDPQITIGGHLYSYWGGLYDGERLEIDQIARTVTKIDTSGNRYNMFNNRNKEHDIFQHVPSGASDVQFGGLRFDIKLIQQRSEPRWT